MKGYCEECDKDVDIKDFYFRGFNCTVYYKCGHHTHYIFAFKSTKEHHGLGKKAFEATTTPILLVPEPHP